MSYYPKPNLSLPVFTLIRASPFIRRLIDVLPMELTKKSIQELSPAITIMKVQVWVLCPLQHPGSYGDKPSPLTSINII